MVRKTVSTFAAILASLCLLSACATAAPLAPAAPAAHPTPLAAAAPAPQTAAVVQEIPAAGAPALPAVPAAQIAATGPLAEMDQLLAKAQDAADTNHLAEAIRNYIAVIAIYEGAQSPETKAKAELAAGELAKIGSRLTLEPSGEWVDPKGAQISVNTRSVGKEGALNPSVYLFESFGAGKAPVPDAPIFFEFVKGEGSLVQLVTTDAYGKANTTVAKIAEPGKEAVVRAYPLFRSRGKTYAFKSVFRDFAYLPPANIARVAALEISDLGVNENPQAVDSVITTLKPVGLQMAAYNGKLNPDSFKMAFGGDAAALKTIAGEAPYTAFILIEATDIRQMELNGKKYNIYTTMVKATFRLVRADGTAVYALPLDAVKGQGGTREAAVADGYKRARDALAPALQGAIPGIRDALNKE